MGLTDKTHFGLTVEDLPFGVEPPVGMPSSGAADPKSETIPPRLDDIAPGPILGAFLSSVDVSKLSGFDQIVVLRAHQRMASFYQAATYQDVAAINETMSTFDGYPQPDVEAAGMAAAEIRVALNSAMRLMNVPLSRGTNEESCDEFGGYREANRPKTGSFESARERHYASYRGSLCIATASLCPPTDRGDAGPSHPTRPPRSGTGSTPSPRACMAPMGRRVRWTRSTPMGVLTISTG